MVFFQTFRRAMGILSGAIVIKYNSESNGCGFVSPRDLSQNLVLFPTHTHTHPLLLRFLRTVCSLDVVVRDECCDRTEINVQLVGL